MILLAKKWNGHSNPKGWLVSEKLDGYRCIWNGKNLVGRSGNGLGSIIDCPEWFTKGFPSEPLDGEIWAGRGGFETVASTVKGSRKRAWHDVVYAVFDAQEYPGGFEQRIDHARAIVHAPHAIVIPFWVCTSKDQLLKKLDEVVAGGGEGLMLRKPNALYERKRSNTLLKVKKHTDAEAVIIGHVEGTRPGLCGALKVITRDGKIFKVASGMTEEMAADPPSIGTIITYKWEVLSKDGIPRPATFVRIKDL
jgi:DNA ligase 1